jgi:hypothetical protein
MSTLLRANRTTWGCCAASFGTSKIGISDKWLPYWTALVSTIVYLCTHSCVEDELDELDEDELLLLELLLERLELLELLNF